MNCSRCGQPIEGNLEIYTAISDVNGTTAHFWCYYPHGVADRSLPMVPSLIDYIQRVSPERARFFHAYRKPTE